jgi:hypothetical protein
LPPVGGALKSPGVTRGFRLLLAATFGLMLGGCVQQAVLENDVRDAQWKARVLSTQNDLELAEAALAAQLVELEALYQRAPGDARVVGLLAKGYWLWADGFIEGRKIEAMVAGNQPDAARQERRQAQARARRSYYSKLAAPSAAGAGLAADSQPDFGGAWLLERPRAACAAHDRVSYERELTDILRAPEDAPEARLGLALAQRLAKSWLDPAVSARCKF